MEIVNGAKKLAKEAVEQRKKEIAELEAEIVKLESEQEELEEQMIMMLEWIEELKLQQAQLEQNCRDLEVKIRNKKLPGSFIEKLNGIKQKIANAIKLDKQEEKGLKMTLTKQEKKDLASELVGQSNIGVDLKPLVQEAINDKE
jgi:chromosome segregation ATPase